MLDSSKSGAAEAHRQTLTAAPSLATADILAARRARLCASVSEGAVVIVPGAAMVSRNADVEHDFRQDSDFFYLTGFDEPDALAVLRPGRDPGFVLFVRPSDPDAETWTGRRAGLAGARARFGADAAYDVGALDSELPRLLEGATSIQWVFGRDERRDAAYIRAAQHHWRTPRVGAVGPNRYEDLRPTLHELRLRKAPEEIASLRRAARITAEGHHEAMRLAAAGRWEYELAAVMEMVFRVSGSQRNGYPSIVAGGDNATILHYNTNRMRLEGGALVLIDAGAEFGYHTADVTRTFPVDGRFSPAQRDVYAIVLAAEEASIALTRAGTTYLAAHECSVRMLTQGLVDLGVLSGSVDGLIETEAFKPWFMHRTGHWLGMDVHDVGLYANSGAPRLLEVGMVTTVEPGLYFAAHDERVPVVLRGIGVRIEDDVLVGEDGPDVLSIDCVKAIDDVEAICAEAPLWIDRRRLS